MIAIVLGAVAGFGASYLHAGLTGPTGAPGPPGLPGAQRGVGVAGYNLLSFPNIDPTGKSDSTSGIQTAIDKVRGSLLVAPAGTYLVNGLKFKGTSSSFQGIGDGTVFKAKPGIPGPVMDFAGYSSPPRSLGKRPIGNFSILGSGEAGTEKKGISATGGLVGMVFSNITITNTGGTPLDVSGAELSEFTNIVLGQPESAEANNVSYLFAAGATNGNRFVGVGLRSTSATNPEGVGGAVRIVDDGTHAPEFNLFQGCWFEYLHLPSAGTLFYLAGAKNSIVDTQFFDQAKVAGATGTSYFTLAAPQVSDSGGNEIRGYIPGMQGGGTSIDNGVLLTQSGNRITGVKGYNGNNVALGLGVGATYASLGGQEASASKAAFTDKSGMRSNVLIDSTDAARSPTGLSTP